MWSGRPLMLPAYFYWLLLLAITAYAIWRGRSDERIVAAACLMASLITYAVLSPRLMRYSEVEMGVLMVDIGVLAVFTGVALQSNRFWPLWVAGLQLTTSIAHLLKAIDADLLPHAYGVAARFWSYPILLIVAVGTWRSHRRRRAQRTEQVPA
jgi:hypothetical protein